MTQLSWSQIRTIASWGTIVSFLTFFGAEQVMGSMNPAGYHSPWPVLLERPRSFELALWTRNISILCALVFGLISIPRKPGLVGLVLTVIYAAYGYVLFAMY